MALLHSMSGECIKSELDLFTVPQTVLEKNTYLEVPPFSAISYSVPLEFFITGTGEDYLDLNNTLLFLRLKITKPNGGDIPDPASVGLINYPGATIFSQVDVSLGDRLISQSLSTYPHRCMIECLMNYSKDVLETIFTSGLFHKDEAGEIDENDPLDDNEGLTKRSNYTKGGKVVELLAPIHRDIFFQEKLLLNGVDFKIHLIRAKNKFCLMRSDDVAYKVKIVLASLFVEKVCETGACPGSAHRYCKVPYRQSMPQNPVYTPTGSRVSNQENLFLGTLPKSIILGMVDNDAFTGAYNKNPFTFNHYDMEFLAIYVDGQQVPAKPLQPDFDSGAAAREYYQLVMSTGRHLKNHWLAFDRGEFMNGYSLFAFNLTPDEECGQHLSLVKSGNIRLEVRFKKALAKTITLIVYALFDSIIQVSNRRQILVDHY
ncbi:uncharacterized protein F54H12.2-like [Triplophysa rosa]|uniref:Uncharacterized protein n=1 Tax=Triplophysa rosa TaxID=992332 RepID=A0A9W7W7R2_TRIRA|nr:uncharacterized protein F54H12.2-like [Triplophysa rosa]KAI7790097.1 hypothetical protein IRJ41_012035 [Triplophysa rosa]